MVDITSLQNFLALVEHGSFTRAASAQHLSQSAFSRRIRMLEQWIGTDVVDRSTFPVTLTPTGAKLHEQAAHMVAELTGLRDQARGRSLIPRDCARVATSHALATGYFMGWWQRLGFDKMQIPLILLPANTLESYEALLHGDCDLLLAYVDSHQPLSAARSDLEWLVIDQDRIAPYSPVRSGKPQFTLPGNASGPVPFVSHPSNTFFGRITDRILASTRPRLTLVAQADLTSALLEMVAAGSGIGWLPEFLATAAVHDDRIREISEQDPKWCSTIEIRLYRGRGESKNRHATKIWQHAQTTALASP